ncbi:DUF2478 domain-containing protein [Magnetospira sp. QH-2]|uniref:DUF2478 domain-containing protein n=1 Tax=Magnetospira sp. (strain QH-2) TaxID=1288970 RepID=UPI0003E8133F|nr:DUF2478 domain-containing protein [Magnetospira sp. QH-2]CCQ74085.1 Conserved protein of unknown function [Magnetospira sp. QH-2]
MSLALPRLAPAAVIYTGDTVDTSLLARFAADLKDRGWSVGGIVQEKLTGEAGQAVGRDLIDLTDGRRIPLARPSPGQIESGSCAMDESALAEAGPSLRRSMDNGADLLIIEKFGRMEQEHGGLLDEIMTAMAEGFLVLTAVSASALEQWSQLTGGMTRLLAWTEADLWRWWGPHRLARELELSVDLDAVAGRVVLGRNWTLVEGPDGCGLAQTPERMGSAGRPLRDAGFLGGRKLRDLAAWIHSWDPLEAAVGLAAINAHCNRYDLQGQDSDGLDLLAETEGTVTAIGRFPGLATRLGHHRIVEDDPRDGAYPPAAAGWLLPDGPAVIHASALVDRTLPNLLSACRQPAVLMGPGTPLTPRLKAYGIGALAGVVVTDLERVAQAVAEGGSLRSLRPFLRNVLV